MMLSQEEAICFVLGCAQKQEVSSPTKLNKLLARLNLFFIPIDLNFTLNQYGSYSFELTQLQESPCFSKEEYAYMGQQVSKFQLRPQGNQLVRQQVLPKLQQILTQSDIKEISRELNRLSTLSAAELSEDEHSKLLVDVDDKFKLQQRVNEVYVDMSDLNRRLPEIPERTIADIKLRACIDFCFHLTTYLKERRFRTLDNTYDFDAHMLDYYFLHNIQEMIPFLNEQITEPNKDVVRINRYYQFVTEMPKGRYPFSLSNPDLKGLVGA